MHCAIVAASRCVTGRRVIARIGEKGVSFWARRILVDCRRTHLSCVHDKVPLWTEGAGGARLLALLARPAVGFPS